VLDLPAPPDQDPDLAFDLARDAAQVGCELRRGDLPGAKAAPVDALQRVFLAGLQPGRIPGDFVQGGEVSTDGLPLPQSDQDSA